MRLLGVFWSAIVVFTVLLGCTSPPVLAPEASPASSQAALTAEPVSARAGTEQTTPTLTLVPPTPPLAKVIAEAKLSVVRVQTASDAGSGVIIDADGYILTNYHIVRQVTAVGIGLSDGRWLPGTVTAIDEPRDLAIVTVEPLDLRPITLGQSAALEVGDDVVALGYPLDLGGEATATKGMLSARRVDPSIGLTYLQIDAALNPGNSGGALINKAGELVGLNTGGFRLVGGVPVEGMGFAIAVDEVGLAIGELVAQSAGRTQGLGIPAGNGPEPTLTPTTVLEPEPTPTPISDSVALPELPTPGSCASTDGGTAGAEDEEKICVYSVRSMLVPRMSASCAAVDGKVYVFGGLDSRGSFRNVVEEYDPVADTWKLKAPMPEPKAMTSSVALGGKIYVMGGINEDGVSDSVDVYDAVSDSWTTVATMAEGRWNHMAAVVDGKIYVFGGVRGTGDQRVTLNSHKVFDPVDNSWSRRRSMPSPKRGAAVAVVLDKIYVLGGRSGAATGGYATRTSLVYDPAWGVWSTLQWMEEERAGGQAVGLDGTIYLIGGVADGEITDSILAYDPHANTWVTTPATLQQERSGHCVAAVGERAYVIGGAKERTVEGIVGVVEELAIE